jgi:predicted NBD/HSP70 family sugar kinase
MFDRPTAFAANKAMHVRRYNRRVLLHALRIGGGLSRAELARATGLTPQAVANIVEDLISAGLAREAGRRKSERGQPPIAIEIASDGGYAVGVRVDATHYHAVAANLAGDILDMREEGIASTSEADLLDLFAGLHAEFARRYGAERCLGFGLVTPGPFDTSWPDGGLTPGQVATLRRRSFAALLAERVGTDVRMENDATAAALGEKLYGAARDLLDFVYVFVGEGVGGGIVIGGDPYRGAGGNAAELGHIVVDPSGPRCACGNPGCLGEYLSLQSLRRQFGRSDFSATEVASGVIDSWIGGAADALSIALAGLENVFDPEAVILGGSARPPLLERLRSQLAALRPSVRQDADENSRLRLSTLGESSSALGASALPILAATSPSPLNLIGGDGRVARRASLQSDG